LSQLTHSYTIKGEPVKSFILIHPDCRCLIVSGSPVFLGLKGIKKFKKSNRPQNDISLIKPKPAFWVQAASHDWNKNNKPSLIPENPPTQILIGEPAKKAKENKAGAEIVHAIRDEHRMIHNQNQELLQILKNSPSPQQYTRVENNNEEFIQDIYESFQLEQNIIDFIIEKIVAMIELPYMKLESSIEKFKNQLSVSTLVQNIKQGAFAAKPINRRMIKVDLKTIKQTAPYEGGEFN